MNIHALHSLLGRIVDAKTRDELAVAGEHIAAAKEGDDDYPDAATKMVLRQAYAIREGQVE